MQPETTRKVPSPGGTERSTAAEGASEYSTLSLPPARRAAELSRTDQGRRESGTEAIRKFTTQLQALFQNLGLRAAHGGFALPPAPAEERAPALRPERMSEQRRPIPEND